MYGYEWTDEYGIFRLTVNAKIKKEIRPVFHEELDFFGMRKFWDYPTDTDKPLLWAEGIRKYVLNGQCVAEAKGGDFYTRPKVECYTAEHLNLKPVDTDRLYAINRDHMISIEQKAVSFIQEQYSKYSNQGFYFICAFSGGKDSLVLLDLVAKALPPDDFRVVFSNTGMELSDTLASVERAKEHWNSLHFIEAKCDRDPTETWDLFGPPGRRLRWCCVVHKSTPTILKLREVMGDYNAKAVVFDGVRAEESPRRAKYQEVSIGAKNISQINASPLFQWETPELYCYILKNSILFNDVYKLGLFRVGCMVCPLSSEWWEGIANSYYRDEMQPLLHRVEEYARRTKPEKEVKKYIASGGWKARMGGRGLVHGGNRVTEQIQNNSIIFFIKDPIQKWLSVAPVLGTIIEQNETSGIQKIAGNNYEFRISHSDGATRVAYWPFSKMDRFVISHLRGVANKVAYCEGCKACVVQCPTGAYTIQDDRSILIRQSLCINCSNCITSFEKGCLLAKSISITSPGGDSMDMKGLNPYQHFGLQQKWMEHFMFEGIQCFDQNVLGNRQYEALKVWLRDAGLIVNNKKDRTLAITSLGQKLINMGPYNLLTWAIVWANLAYNSRICHWYCLNSEIGATYEKSDLVVMLGDNGSLSSRENAITALTETLRYTPIGDGLKQGLALELSKNTFSYSRTGWDYPNAVALLYALYLYAERDGRHSFSFSDMINARVKPDASGISPSDIYGIDSKTFREQVQGLAIQFPKYIRVSFVANLDNIILEDYTSLDILDLAEE